MQKKCLSRIRLVENIYFKIISKAISNLGHVFEIGFLKTFVFQSIFKGHFQSRACLIAGSFGAGFTRKKRGLQTNPGRVIIIVN